MSAAGTPAKSGPTAGPPAQSVPVAAGNPSAAGNAAQSVPVPVGTLSFRAEVMRITKPVKPEVIQKIELLAGTRGLDMIKNSSGETVFLLHLKALMSMSHC